MKKTKTCVLCNGKKFSEDAYFKGTTAGTKYKTFRYARCNSCGSINYMDEDAPDYSGYATGTEISNAKFSRFVKFLRRVGVSRNSAILDYGCGNGALFMKLKICFKNTNGYEPFGKKFSGTLNEGKKYDLVYLTHAFEHIIDYDQFFTDLDNATKPGSLVITIHPSSTRIPKLNSDCAFQRYALHAPFHNVVPSDKATISLFEKQGYQIKDLFNYDVQRSGIKDNNRVSALLAESLGGIKENWLGASSKVKLTAALRSPLRFFDSMFIHTRDFYASTMVFEREQRGH